MLPNGKSFVSHCLFSRLPETFRHFAASNSTAVTEYGTMEQRKGGTMCGVKMRKMKLNAQIVEDRDCRSANIYYIFSHSTMTTRTTSKMTSTHWRSMSFSCHIFNSQLTESNIKNFNILHSPPGARTSERACSFCAFAYSFGIRRRRRSCRQCACIIIVFQINAKMCMRMCLSQFGRVLRFRILLEK